MKIIGNTRSLNTLFMLVLVTMSLQAAHAAPACSANKIKEILEPASSQRKSVSVDCNLSLNPKSVVTKQLVFRGVKASGVQLNCNHASLDGRGVNRGRDMIRVMSQKVRGNWQRPVNVQIKNCRVFGSVRVFGMAQNGEGKELRASSVSAGHSARAQQAAPKYILFDRMQIIGHGRIPFYLAPGVTYTTISNSIFSGTSSSVAIYLDAESFGNTIQRNNIQTKTSKRELIAVDASAGNKILNNFLQNAQKGGIYLYRNCGEGGTVRHQGPQNNQILNNAFSYQRSWFINPSIWLGSRQGNRNYCSSDRGYRFGSSASDRDFAQRNVIRGNQFVGLDPTSVIRNNDQNNSIVGNVKVYRQTVYSSAQATNNSEIAPTTNSSRINVPFGCNAQGTNQGCTGIVSCPTGMRVQAAKAACNLEAGRISPRHVNNVPWNTLWVIRPSDRVWDGQCALQNNRRRYGRGAMNGLVGSPKLKYSCREKDRNGGDCDIKGVIQCQ